MTMSAQEIFTKVSTHLLTQRRRSQYPSGQCSYWIPESGLKCAVGCLIPDGHPALGSEGSVSFIMSEYSDLFELFGQNNIQLLSTLQEIHDARDPGSEWRGELEYCAIRFGLEFTPPKET